MSPVLLLSGGLDSAVCLAQMAGVAEGLEALFVDYGQPHVLAERHSAELLSRAFGTPLRYANVALPEPVCSPFREHDPAMVVPGRNLVLIALAATIGEPVILGCNADDDEVYEDCRREFFNALAPTVLVTTPLLDLTKEQIGDLAREFEIADLTWSCYYPQPGKGPTPCGECDACAGRKRALP